MIEKSIEKIWFLTNQNVMFLKIHIINPKTIESGILVWLLADGDHFELNMI